MDASLQRHYLTVNLGDGRHSLVEYFNEVVKNATEYVVGVASKRLEEAQQELRRLTEEARLDERRRKEEVDRVSRQIGAWTGFGEELAALAGKLGVHDGVPTPQPADGATAR
jgi:hypothetical protein